MNITVYLGASAGNDPVYTRAVRELGEWIAKNGHALVYGGANVGLMGELANAALDAGGAVIGVIPQFMVDWDVHHEGLTEFIVVETMAERKAKMIEFGDAFVACPGGPGTLEELSEIVSLVKIDQPAGPAVLYNVDGFYDDLARAYERMVSAGFMTKTVATWLHVIERPEQLADVLVADHPDPGLPLS